MPETSRAVPSASVPAVDTPRGGAPPARVLLLGMIGAAAAAALVTEAEMALDSLRIGILQFPPAALGLLLLTAALGRGVRRVRSRWGLSSSDLLVIYCMALVAALVSSHGLVEKWIPMLVAPKYFANASNGWHQAFDTHLPLRLVPYDPRDSRPQGVATGYYEGLPAGAAIPWHAWTLPLLNWSVLIVLVLFAFLCLTAILRRQWVDNERLSFPLTQLPLEIAGDEGRPAFFRSRLMWIGTLLPTAIYTAKALHQWLPTVPDIPVQFTLNDYLTTAPWNQIAWTPFVLSFAAVGFFFLLPADMLFSLWFFFLLSRLQQVVAISFNIDMPTMPTFPLPLFLAYQTMGAYFVLTAYLLWIARGHLRGVWAAALGRGRADDAQELLPYRVAVWGLFGSILASSLWLWGMGMSLWLALLELIVFLFVIAVIMARSTAEAGLLMTETTFRPVDLYRMAAPLHGLGAANLTLLAFVDDLFLRDQRGLLLTSFLDAARMADGTAFRRRTFVGVLTLGVVVAAAVAVVMNISLPYHLGALRMDAEMEQSHAQMLFQSYAPYFAPGATEQPGVSGQMLPNFVAGALVTLALTWLRSVYYWWPLHPLGYVLSGSWGTVEFWFPCFIAWALKSLAVRYGGLQFYQTIRPFFLGLIVGEFGIEFVLVLLRVFLHLPAPQFPWF